MLCLRAPADPHRADFARRARAVRADDECHFRRAKGADSYRRVRSARGRGATDRRLVVDSERAQQLQYECSIQRCAFLGSAARTFAVALSAAGGAHYARRLFRARL